MSLPAAKRTIPRATIRLQFHAGFTLDDAAARVDDFAALGVTHVYASPLFEAREGSTHGYDVTDYGRIRAALGGMPALERLVAKLRARGMGLVIDIVPNHMAADAGNAWWWDVLKRGRDSAYADYFDIDWTRGKILAPFLGRPYGDVLDARELALSYDTTRGEFVVRYFDTVFPVRDAIDASSPDAIAVALRYYTGDRLHELLEAQPYRLAHWRAANDSLNWRRFFDVTELVAFRADEPDAFRDSHVLVAELNRRGLIDGVRVDHVDGLADPRRYLESLRALLGPDAWIVVEKILAANEALPAWPVEGTTGYEFMDLVSAVLHDPRGALPLAAHWRDVTGDPLDAEAHVRAARRQIAEQHFGGDVEACVERLAAAARRSLRTQDLTTTQVGHAFLAVLDAFPVYRDYAGVDHDPAPLRLAVDGARRALATRDQLALDFVAAQLGGEDAELLRRFRHLTPPLAAKAIEDTTFYRYAPLLSRNEVGADPARFAIDADAFHLANATRLARTPHSLLATATHDHKRGEDARMRLAVLGERFDAWIAASSNWRALLGEGAASIHPADLEMLLQTIVGAWPLDDDLEDAATRRMFVDRIAAWQRKALREGKLRSHWTEPDEAYEAKARGALDALFDAASIRASMRAFVDSIAPAGAVLSLAQAVLRCTSPGVPDLYQGTDGWDFSLVDPDNRRPVDFDERARWIAENVSPLDALPAWQDGRVKHATIRRLLALRHTVPMSGYRPLEPQGAMASHVVAFARGDVVVAVPRLVSTFVADTPSVANVPWGDTVVPVESGVWVDVLTGRHHRVGNTAAATLLFGEFPVAVLRRA